MGFPQRQVAIVGVYTTEVAKSLPDRTSFSLQLESIQGALDDAGLTINDVDGLCPMIFTDHLNNEPMNLSMAHLFWAEQLGERPMSLVETGNGCGPLAKAAASIAAGLANVAVLFTGKAGKPIGPGGTPTETKRAPRVQEWSFTQTGVYMSTWYALWAQRYMHEFGVTSADLAEVAVFTRHHATLNPNSMMGHRGELTVDQVLESRYVCEPLHLFDCSIDNDGGYAIVIASADVAKDCKTKPVWILGGAESYYTDFYTTINDPWFPEEGKGVRKAADTAFGLAGITRDDIDVAGLYDCFTITTIRDFEEMGFCKLGEGAEFVKEGHCKLGGKMPTNTDGGLLSHSHTGNPDGLPTIEVVRQLRGGCGARQVPDAKVGVSLAQGWGVHAASNVLVMGTD